MFKKCSVYLLPHFMLSWAILTFDFFPHSQILKGYCDHFLAIYISTGTNSLQLAGILDRVLFNDSGVRYHSGKWEIDLGKSRTGLDF